jgi:hypothetical protein
MSAKTWDELGRETAAWEREREQRAERVREADARHVRVGMTRGEARAAAIGLMMIGAHKRHDDPDKLDDGDLHAAYCALAKAGGIERSS